MGRRLYVCVCCTYIHIYVSIYEGVAPTVSVSVNLVIYINKGI